MRQIRREKRQRIVSSILFLVIMQLLLGACASVKFIDKNGVNTGFLYYPPKPYLLVETTKEKGTTARLISMPNLSDPRYVKYKGGWGSVTFAFDVTDGMITKFNGTVDSKGPETITAATTGLGSIASGLAAIRTAKAALIEAQKGPAANVKGPVQTFELKDVQTAREKVNLTVEKMKKVEEGPLFEIKNELKKISQNLGAVESFTYRNAEEFLQKVREVQEKIRPILRALEESRSKLHGLASSPEPETKKLAREVRAIVDGAITELSRTVDTFSIPDLTDARQSLRALSQDLCPTPGGHFVEVCDVLGEQAATLLPYDRVPLPADAETLPGIEATLKAARKDALRVAGILKREQQVLGVISGEPQTYGDASPTAARASGVLETIAKKLEAFAAGPAPSVQLYEIIASGGSVEFRRVVLE